MVSYGEPPWQIQNNDVTITIKNSVVTTATIIDLNGVAREEQPLLTDGAEVSYTLPSDAKYVVLR